jgi:hypothetical protein
MIPIPSYSQITDLLKKGLTLEAQEEIMKLREAALGLQEENIGLKQDLQTASKKVTDLEERLSVKTQLRHEPPVYYREGDAVPFCQVCWERDHKLSHLVVTASDSGGLYGECKICEKHFVIRGSTNPRPGSRRVLSRREMLERAGF